MKRKIIFLVSAIGLVAGLSSAYVFGIKSQAQPPAFKPATNPYAQGIYANGIIESDQPGGENINIYAEVAGPITQVLAAEGDRVAAGAPLVRIDDSVPRATAEQLRLQAEGAQALLQELRSQPRKESSRGRLGPGGRRPGKPEDGGGPVHQAAPGLSTSTPNR